MKRVENTDVTDEVQGKKNYCAVRAVIRRNTT